MDFNQTVEAIKRGWSEYIDQLTKRQNESTDSVEKSLLASEYNNQMKGYISFIRRMDNPDGDFEMISSSGRKNPVAEVTVRYDLNKNVVNTEYNPDVVKVMHKCNYRWDKSKKEWYRTPDSRQQSMLDSATWLIYELISIGCVVRYSKDENLMQKIASQQWIEDKVFDERNPFRNPNINNPMQGKAVTVYSEDLKERKR